MDITVDVAAVEEYIVSDVGKGKARRRIVLGLLNTEAIINDLNYSIYIYIDQKIVPRVRMCTIRARSCTNLEPIKWKRFAKVMECF